MESTDAFGELRIMYRAALCPEFPLHCMCCLLGSVHFHSSTAFLSVATLQQLAQSQASSPLQATTQHPQSSPQLKRPQWQELLPLCQPQRQHNCQPSPPLPPQSPPSKPVTQAWQRCSQLFLIPQPGWGQEQWWGQRQHAQGLCLEVHFPLGPWLPCCRLHWHWHWCVSASGPVLAF